MGDDPNQRGLSRKHIMHSIDDCLRRLGIDYVDLYQIHRFDHDDADRGDARGAARRGAGRQGALHRRLVDVRLAVRARCCTPPTSSASRRFVTMQNHYNLVYREEEREMIPLCRDEGIGLIPWSPLARGFLAGNRTPPGQGRDDSRAKTDDFAHRLYYRRRRFHGGRSRQPRSPTKRGVPNAQVALAWLLSQPGVTAPIVGASKMNHLDDAVAALDTETRRRRDQGAGGTLPPAPGARARVRLCSRAHSLSVTPAKAGVHRRRRRRGTAIVQAATSVMDSGFRRNDGEEALEQSLLGSRRPRATADTPAPRCRGASRPAPPA